MHLPVEALPEVKNYFLKQFSMALWTPNISNSEYEHVNWNFSSNLHINTCLKTHIQNLSSLEPCDTVNFVKIN